jgi:hypothetical protein
MKGQSRRVVRADQSPMNEKRWCLTLACGCEVWVTSGFKPLSLWAKCERDHVAHYERVMSPRKCQRSKGHTGAHACPYDSDFYRSLWWREQAGGTVWEKHRGRLQPETAPLCLEPGPHGVAEAP